MDQTWKPGTHGSGAIWFENAIGWDHGRLGKRGRLETAASRGPIVSRVRGKQPQLNQESLPSLRHPHVVAAIELVGRDEDPNAHRKRLNRKAGKFGKTSAAFRHYARYL